MTSAPAIPRLWLWGVCSFTFLSISMVIFLQTMIHTAPVGTYLMGVVALIFGIIALKNAVSHMGVVHAE